MSLDGSTYLYIPSQLGENEANLIFNTLLVTSAIYSWNMANLSFFKVFTRENVLLLSSIILGIIGIVGVCLGSWLIFKIWSFTANSSDLPQAIPAENEQIQGM
jgi:hypothetical protein